MVDQSMKETKRRRRGRKNGAPYDTNMAPKIKDTDPSLQNSLLIQLSEEAPTWHQFGQKLPERNATVTTSPPTNGQKNSSELVSKYRTLADSIYRREVQLFAKASGKSSDDRWVESTIQKGTLKDRIAAMSVVVSTNPIHKFHALDGLLQMAGCLESSGTNSRVAQLAAEALEDLFLNTFLPSNRKLLTLEHRPLYRYEHESTNTKKTKKTLSPRILLLWRFEEMVKTKYQLFLRQYVAHTLREGLELHKIAALRSAAALLKTVPEQEGFILQIMVNKLGDPDKKVAAAAGHELRQVLRQHPAMQTVMAREVQQLAHRPHLSSRALYNCITFLNQLKLSKDTSTLPASLVNTYFRLFEVAVQTPNDTSTNTEAASMRSRLLSALLTGVNRAHPYLPDKDREMEQHMDVIYRVAHTAPPAAATQALLLLFHVVVGSKLDEEDDAGDSKKAALTKEEIGRQDRFYRALYSTLQDPALLGSGKHLTMYFNLLYKAMKYDRDTTRVIAYAKHILCTTMHCSSSVIAASLFLLSEISKHHPALLTCFQDVLRGPDATRVLDPTKREPRAALVSHEDAKKDDNDREVLAPVWEVSMALNFFHPSVQKFATDMGGIDYAGDPLKDFALAPFLDKFAYRNPKSSVKPKRGDSVAARRTQSLVDTPVNDPSFIQRADVEVQDDFFYKFFVEQARRDKIKGIVRHKQTDDQEEEDHALDVAEERNVDHVDFEDFEHQWETDSEEEAFVDSLAEKIIEDSIEVEGYGPADLDDEDPDMDEWDDMYSDDDGDHKDGIDGQEDYEEDQAGDEQRSDEDVDAFMEGSEESSDEEEEEPDFELDAEIGVAGFGRPEDNSDEEEDSEEEQALQHALDDEEDTEDDLALEDGSSSSDEEEETKKPPSKNPKGKKTKEEASVFAAVEDYEEMINKSWNELKRPRIQQAESNDDHAGDVKQEIGSKKRKKKKRRKR